MAKTKFCQGVSDISDSYMGFIIDQWGTLHDGENLFPGVLDCMKELKERKKTILLLSNSTRRAEFHKDELKKMGLGPSLYSEIVTSGEVIWQGLHRQTGGVFQKIGKKCFVFSRGDDTSILDGTGVTAVDDIENADFVLITGMDYPRKTLEHYEPLIRRAIQLRLKAVCPSPDSLSMIGNALLKGPSLLARRYQDSGGIVYHIGKPHSLIFMHCIEILKEKEIYPSGTVVLGDTMAHDVIGGHAVSLDTCLFKSGLHAANFGHCQTPKEVHNALKNLIAVYNNVMPTYLADEMRWGRALPDRKHKKRKQPKS
ncbi:MAG: TIGR01459 family HAD-type hydrolase [Rhodospirillales bacterium]|nr:TIGR01459 family HAD-type hydrolase [Alphaproteobacteria bacterium]USO03374.1 MAG: TIGR01459 family HAD-type hydrolase [Rhodospirillales bacterium]